MTTADKALPWDERLDNPSQHSLVDLLEGFYKAFDIADYLDQIGIIDDRLDDIQKRLDFILEHLAITDPVRIPLTHIRNLIDAGNSPD